MMRTPARTWPAGRPIPEALARIATCPACGASWRVHRNLSGFRFVCAECSAWVPVGADVEQAPRSEISAPMQDPLLPASSESVDASAADPGEAESRHETTPAPGRAGQGHGVPGDAPTDTARDDAAEDAERDSSPTSTPSATPQRTPAHARSRSRSTPSRVDDASPNRSIARMPRDDNGFVVVDLSDGELYQGEIRPSVPLAPGGLVHARVVDRQRWSNRAALEIGAMLAGILVPFVAAQQFLTGDQAATLLPLASLFGACAVVLVGLASPHYTFGGLRGAKPEAFAIAAALGVGGAFLGDLWIQLLETLRPHLIDELAELPDRIGLGMTLFVVAVVPAFVEELAFRGLLQGRLGALFGRVTGILVTAALFAAAHGIGYGTPFHVALGIALGFMRDRWGSLLPCMLLHATYNGTLVLLAS
jgi:membrane protease YdiL (CAAX protease family)